MKKAWIIVLAILLLAGIMVIKVGEVAEAANKELDQIETVSIENVADGQYEGVAETPLVKVTVRVTVEDHQITDIELLRHENGKGESAESMLPQMISQNTSDVDLVSGATLSSKTIKAAVNDALAKGVNR